MKKAKHVLYLLWHIVSMMNGFIFGIWLFLILISILIMIQDIYIFKHSGDMTNHLPLQPHGGASLWLFIIIGWYLTLADLLGMRSDNESFESPNEDTKNAKKGMSFYRLLPLEMETLSLTLAIGLVLPLAYLTFFYFSVAALDPDIVYLPNRNNSEEKALANIQECYPGIQVVIQKQATGENAYKLIGVGWYDALSCALQIVLVGITGGIGLGLYKSFRVKYMNANNWVWILIVLAYACFGDNWVWDLVVFSRLLSALILMFLLVGFFFGSKWYLEKEML